MQITEVTFCVHTAGLHVFGKVTLLDPVEVICKVHAFENCDCGRITVLPVCGMSSRKFPSRPIILHYRHTRILRTCERKLNEMLATLWRRVHVSVSSVQELRYYTTAQL